MNSKSLVTCIDNLNCLLFIIYYYHDSNDCPFPNYFSRLRYTSILLGKKNQITCFFFKTTNHETQSVVTTIITIRFPRKRSTIIHSFPRKKKKKKNTSQIEQFILDTIKRQDFVFPSIALKISRFDHRQRLRDPAAQSRDPLITRRQEGPTVNKSRFLSISRVAVAITVLRRDLKSIRQIQFSVPKLVRNSPPARPEFLYISNISKRNHDLHTKREETPRQRSPVSQLGRFCLENRLASLLELEYAVSIGQGREGSTRPETISRGETDEGFPRG